MRKLIGAPAMSATAEGSTPQAAAGSTQGVAEEKEP